MKTFEKIIGYELVKKELYQIIDMFKNRKMYEDIGAKLPKGLLILGEPGMGKTTLAQAMIEECGCKKYVIKNDRDTKDLLKYIDEVFEESKKESQCIILFDDLDKLAEGMKNNDAMIFTYIQSKIDDVKNYNVFIIATVNYINKLPTSLIRCGRFDKKINLSTPSNKESELIIEHYLKTKKISKNLNLSDVSKMISYTSCAELETILNESAIHAKFERKDEIEIDDIVEAFLKENFGHPLNNQSKSNEYSYLTSLHECGHIVVGEILKSSSVGFACINYEGSDSYNGFTKYCDNFKRRSELVMVTLAGKAACELYGKGRCASGCQDDLNKAINLIRDGISVSGSHGLAMLDVSNERFPHSANDYVSRNESVTIAELERLMFLTKDILINNKDFLEKLANALENKKYLLFSDIQRIKSNVEVSNFQLN